VLSLLTLPVLPFLMPTRMVRVSAPTTSRGLGASPKAASHTVVMMGAERHQGYVANKHALVERWQADD
jgi:hypothetical protein